MVWISHGANLQLHAFQQPGLDRGILQVTADKASMGRCECIRAYHGPHTRNLIWWERNHIWVAPHEGKRIQTRRLCRALYTDGIAVIAADAGQREHEGVGDEDVSIKQQHKRTRKVTTNFDGPHPGIQYRRLHFREELPVRRDHSRPLSIVGRNVYGARKGARPDDVRAVKVRVADDNGLQTTRLADAADSLIVQKGDAVPEYVAYGGLDESRALTDAERGFGTDVGDAVIARIRLEDVAVLRRRDFQGSDRCERLARRGDKLSRVIANVAGLDGRAIGRGELCSARMANQPRIRGCRIVCLQ